MFEEPHPEHSVNSFKYFGLYRWRYAAMILLFAVRNEVNGREQPLTKEPSLLISMNQ